MVVKEMIGAVLPELAKHHSNISDFPYWYQMEINVQIIYFLYFCWWNPGAQQLQKRYFCHGVMHVCILPQGWNKILVFVPVFLLTFCSPAPPGSCGGWFVSEGSHWVLVRPLAFKYLFYMRWLWVLVHMRVLIVTGLYLSLTCNYLHHYLIYTHSFLHHHDISLSSHYIND